MFSFACFACFCMHLSESMKIWQRCCPFEHHVNPVLPEETNAMLLPSILFCPDSVHGPKA